MGWGPLVYGYVTVKNLAVGLCGVWLRNAFGYGCRTVWNVAEGLFWIVGPCGIRLCDCLGYDCRTVWGVDRGLFWIWL